MKAPKCFPPIENVVNEPAAIPLEPSTEPEPAQQRSTDENEAAPPPPSPSNPQKELSNGD